MGTYYPNLLATRILYDSDRSSASASDDGDVANWIKTNKFILATLIGYDGKDTAAAAYKLRWRNETDNPGGSFTDLGATGEMKYAASSSVLSDGTALTEANHRCTGPGGMTWQNGLESVNDNLVPDAGTFDLGSDCYTEFQWAIDPADAHDGDQYTFQLYNNTEGAGDECLAQLTIVMPVKLAHADIACSGSLSAAAKVTRKVHADLVGGGTLAAAAQCLVLVAADLYGSGTLTASATKLTPPPATQQVISGGYYDNLNSSTTEYQMIQGGTTWGSTEGNYAVPWPCAGKIVEFGFAVQTGQITAGSYTATLRKNSAATELAVTVNSGTSEGVDTGEVTVAAGDLICIQSTPSAVTGTPYACWYIVFEPTTPGDTVILGLAQRSTASLYYSSFFVNAPYGLPTADGFNLHSLIPTPGTLSKFYAKTPASTDGSNYLTFTVYKNGTVTDLAAVQSDAQYPDLTDSVSLADQDRIQVRIAQTGSVAGAVLLWSAVFHPDTHGEFIFACSTSDEPASAGTEYHGFNSQYYTSVWDADETRYWHLLGACTLKKIRVQLAVAPGSSKSRAFTVRRVATGDTSLAVTLSESETDDTYSTDVAVSQLWKMNLKHVPSGTPTASTGQRWAILGYIAPVGGVTHEAHADLVGSGVLAVATTKVTRKVAGDLVGSGTVAVATTKVTRKVAADLQGSGTLGATAYYVRFAEADIAGSGTLAVATTKVTRKVAAECVGSGSLTAAAKVTRKVAADLVGSGTLDATAKGTKPTAADLVGSGTLAASAQLFKGAHAECVGSGSLSASAKVTRAVAADLVGSGALSASAKMTLKVAADLIGEGFLAADAAILGTVLAQASLTGSGSLSAAAKMTYKAAAADLIENFEWGQNDDPISDSGGPITWVVYAPGSSKAVISTAQAYEGTRSLGCYSDGTNPGSAYTEQFVAKGDRLNFRARRQSNMGWRISFGNGVHQIAILVHSNGTHYRIKDDWAWETVDSLNPMAADTWVEYSLRNVDFVNGTFDWYKGSTLIGEAVLMRHEVAYTNRLTFSVSYSGAQAGWCWYDLIGLVPQNCHVDALAKVTRTVAASLSGSGTLSAEAIVGLLAAASLAGSGSLSAEAKRIRKAVAQLVGSGTIDASPKLTRTAAAALVGNGSLEAAAKRTRAVVAELVGHGYLAAAAEVIAAAIAMYGDMVIRPDLYGDISVRPDLTGNLSMRPDLTGVFSYKGEDQE